MNLKEIFCNRSLRFLFAGEIVLLLASGGLYADPQGANPDSGSARRDSISSEETSTRQSISPFRPQWFPGKKWQAGTGVLFASGDFGTDTRARFLTMDVSIGRVFKKGDITLSWNPLVSASTTRSVTLLLDETPERTDRASSGRLRETGLGDISLEGRYYLKEENKKGFFSTVALTGQIKFPTASEKRGLGSGKFDERIGLEFSKGFLRKWVAYVDTGYVFIGGPSGSNLRNDQWEYAPGLAYLFTPKWMALISYQESFNFSSVRNPRSFLGAVVFSPKPRVQILVIGLAGVSDTAPDYGVGSRVLVQF